MAITEDRRRLAPTRGLRWPARHWWVAERAALSTTVTVILGACATIQTPNPDCLTLTISPGRATRPGRYTSASTPELLTQALRA